MPKYFVSKEHIKDGFITFNEENASHLKVVRAKQGDVITVCDGELTDYKCKIDSISKASAELTILEICQCITEPETKITLFQALPKGDKMDFIIQKGVEAGVHSIIPVETTNCISKNKAGKTERWQKISEAAAKQCGRGIIPKVCNTLNFSDAIKLAKNLDYCAVAYEGEKNNGIKNIPLCKHIGIFIGPEGGFACNEIGLLKESGIDTVSLGKRILRTETAGFAAILIILYIQGDL